MFATRIDADLLKKVKHLSVDTDTSLRKQLKTSKKKHEKLRDKGKR